jgi:hypothetical protein
MTINGDAAEWTQSLTGRKAMTEILVLRPRTRACAVVSFRPIEN